MGLAALAHFVYQGILLPSARLKFRFQLFELRDRLREIPAREVSAEALRVQQETINNAIRLLPLIDAVSFAAFRRTMQDDEALRAQVEKRIRLINEAKSEDFQSVRKQTELVFAHAYLANCGGLIMYVIPLAIVVRFVGKLRSMVSVPESEFGKLELGCLA